MKRARETIGGRPRWGIIGAGGICNDFCVGLVNSGSSITAVAARDMGRARAFAERIGATRAFDSYEALVEDPDVDVVYVGTLTSQHHEHVTLALRAGKHVLCEKPMGANSEQTGRLIELARSKELFLMEAMWTRFFPAVQKAKQVLASGELGKPKAVQGEFGYIAPEDPTHRVWDPAKAGGCMLDIGCYLVQAAIWVFGPTVPESIASTGRRSAEGVDAECSFALTWGDEGSASFLCTLKANTPEDMLIICEKGFIRVHGPAHAPTRITAAKEKGRGVFETELFEFPLPDLPEGHSVNYPHSEGMMYQAQAVERCVVAGDKECSDFTLDESLAIVRVMDECRKQIGVVYPFERS